MPKAELQVAEVTIEDDSPRPKCVATACVELEEAITDRRENGGTRKVVRAKTLSLIEQLFEDLEA